MNVLFVLFDSLIRHGIGPYGGGIHTPNLDRFAESAVVFDRHYAGSLPCIPARRDLMTGRSHFLHASWGSLEPFDRAVTTELRNQKGVYSHLITDHPHYFTNGGWGYHSAFDSWEFVRGQEGDPCVAQVNFDGSDHSDVYDSTYYPVGGEGVDLPFLREQHMKNREHYLRHENESCVSQCFDAAYSFLDTNHAAENWFLQLECFDPHEPFFASQRFREMYGVNDRNVADWPFYRRVFESEDQANALIRNYQATATMCDEYFGRLLNYMDQYNLWDNTMVILTTDHGLLLSEHNWWGKNRQPYYEEICHIPLIVYDPRQEGHRGERRGALTQTPDICATLYDAFDAEAPPEVTGHSLLPIIDEDSLAERGVIFGIFGGAIGATDGRYTYYLYPDDLSSDNNLFEYTLMPEHLRYPMSVDELRDTELYGPFAFTRGVQVLKIRARNDSKRIPLERNGYEGSFQDAGTVLFDISTDPGQQSPISNPDIEKRMRRIIVEQMKRLDAPPEAYVRFRLDNAEKEDS